MAKIKLTDTIRVLFAWATEIALCSNFNFALSISEILNLLKYLGVKEKKKCINNY